MDKLLLSSGYMCDMSWPACVKKVNGVWTFDRKLYWSWLQPLANAGISMHRIALYCVGSTAPRSSLLMPWVFVPSMDAWDLRIRNDAFFSILRQQAIECNKMRTALMVCIQNECEERKPARVAQSPYFHNVNGINGPYDDKVLPYVRNLTTWILDALEGTDFYIELINEGHRRRSGSADVVNAMFPVLIQRNVPPWRISLGADVLDQSLAGFKDVKEWMERWPNELQPPDRENYDIFIDRLHLVKYYDAQYPTATNNVFSSICHNFADAADKDYPKVHPYGRRTGYTKEAWVDRNLASNRVCFSTDGTDHGDAPSGRPSPARMKAAMLYVMRSNSRYKAAPLIKGYPKLWFDFLPHGETTEQIVAVVDAMAEVHKEVFGTWPDNRGHVPTYEEMYPEPTPEPPTPPEPPFPTTCGVRHWWEHLKRLNFKAAWEHLLGKHDA